MATSKKKTKEKVADVVVAPPVQPAARMPGLRVSINSLSLEEAWVKLLPGLVHLFDIAKARSSKDSTFKFPYMEYYTVVYNYCITSTRESSNSGAYRSGSGDFNNATGFALTENGGPAKLAQGIARFVHDHLVETFQTEMLTLRGNELLKRYAAKWTDFRFSARVVHGFCSYLNEHFLRRRVATDKQQETYPIYGVCLKEWRDGALAVVQDELLRGVADVIVAHRNGDNQDAFMVRTVVDCLVDLGLTLDYAAQAGLPVAVSASTQRVPAAAANAKLGLQVYQKYLEEPFFEDTRAYYENESREFLAHNSVARYVEKVHARLKEEEDRCMKYLHPSSCPNLIKTVEDVMIRQQMPVLRAEFMAYLANEKVEELAAMYGLISRVPLQLNELYSAVETHVRQKGLDALARNPESMLTDPVAYVTAILHVHDQCLPLIVRSFNNEKEFVAAFDKGFFAFVNANDVTAQAKSTNVTVHAKSTKSAELFARYCDAMLKKSSKNLSEADLEQTLIRFMVVFKYIEDKDVFQKHYQKCLCRRLISDLSASDDAESLIIGKLKVVAGWEYVTKLQRMFQDKALSVEMNQHFRDADVGGRNDWKFELAVQVLASGSWPLAAGSPLVLPRELARPLEIFEQFYINKFSGRKLTWVFPNSRCELSTNCFKRKHFITVSATQAALMLAFNERTAYTVGELRTIIGWNDKPAGEESQFKQTLLLLLKSHILVITDEMEKLDEKDLMDDGTMIKLNLGFKENRVRMNLNMPLRAEQKQDEESASRGINDDRQIAIQAAIVRVMKMRKELMHQQLLGETMEMLSTRFKPNVAAIKKNIEAMIEKEYLRRSDDDRNKYIYVA